MPELLEIEMYRRAAQAVVGRTIERVDAPDAWYLKGTDAKEITELLVGAKVEATSRTGKLLVLDTSAVPVGLRFGMTGRLVIDDGAVIERLEYSSARLDPAWNRFGLSFEGGGGLIMNDPRRLGGVALDPELALLGIDAWRISAAEFAALCARYRVAIKALLLNQSRIAGLGNLLTDELLWRSDVAPSRQSSDLTAEELSCLWGELGPMLDELYDRGGSHTGDSFDARSPEGRCPRDGHEMSHATIGGRSTYWCPLHQR